MKKIKIQIITHKEKESLMAQSAMKKLAKRLAKNKEKIKA